MNDEWSKEFYEQTKCDIYFNAEILNGMKVLGGTDLNGISAMKVSSMQSMHFTANGPWVLWEKSMKEIDSKLYGAVNHGGAGGMTPGVPLTLLYPLGENAGVSEDKLANLSNSSERQLKGAIDLMIDYNLRSFHKEVYNVKKIPDTQLATR